MNDPSKKTKRRLHRAEAFVIYDLLKRHGIKKPNNIYEYNEGWSDEAIANHVGNGISHWSVKEIRSQSFGLIFKRSPISSKAEMGKRIHDLETKVSELALTVARLSQNGMYKPDRKSTRLNSSH